MNIDNIKILYVEDDKSIIEFIKIIFKKLNILNVTYALNGEEGLTAYQKEQYDLVITDMHMPIMDGFGLIENIREVNPKQVFMMITGTESKEDLIKAIQLRVNYFIDKPIHPKKFREILFECIEFLNQKKELLLSNTLLSQYKEAIDESTILSKADKQGRITYVNEQFCKISQYSKEELIGKPHSILRNSNMPSSVFKELWKTLEEKKQWKGVIKNRAKDGSTYIVDALIMPILDDENNIIEYIGIRHDITENEQYKELLKSELDITSKGLDEKVHLLSEYERVINESSTVSRTDIKGNITYINDRFCKLNGYEQDEILGKAHSILRSPDTPKSFFKELWQTIQNKEVWQGIFKNITKNGDITYMDTTIVPILDINNEIIEYMSIRHDVTQLVNLHQEIEDTQKEVVFTMGAIGESRSKETGNHVKRVAEYSYLLAILAGVDEKEAELLKLASPMHDIGKVGIPDAILNKPGKLTFDEFEIMKTHAIKGYEMLQGSQRDILKISSIVAYEHHEKWDGSGYPNALKGENIHIFGRITAICDVFDALGSNRAYKKAWSLKDILDLFRRERALHFDPTLIDLFFDN
ncbi:PAS domain S-box protein, partial [Arcobacteraceae bacterium]|nr:PAS domain S-box protein [Arcobacteraceae bacterium]